MMRPRMRSNASTLALLLAPALVLAGPAPGSASPDAKPSPEPATSVATAWPAARPAASLPPREPPAPTAPRAAVVPSQAVVEKLGKGDRLALAGDHRNALFAYQDAVYMQPGYAAARVRLGRAYLALRYPAQAIAQAEAALAVDPESDEARRLLEEASAAPARPIVPLPDARDPASAASPPGLPPVR